MKYLLIALIKGYHIFVSPFIIQIVGAYSCRYELTCSEYAVKQIQKHGILYGSYLSLRRLLSCRSW